MARATRRRYRTLLVREATYDRIERTARGAAALGLDRDALLREALRLFGQLVRIEEGGKRLILGLPDDTQSPWFPLSDCLRRFGSVVPG